MLRRTILIIVGMALPFVLIVFGSYMISVHTTDGKLAMWLIVHSQKMTDQQLRQGIGRDPFKVIERAGLMQESLPAIIALVIGTLAACFEKRSPGKIAALVLTPFFLWDFSMSAFSTPRAPAQAAQYAAMVMGINAAYTALAAIVAVTIARLWRQWGNRPQELAS